MGLLQELLDGLIFPCVMRWESFQSTASFLNGGNRRGACLMGVAEPVSIVCSIKWFPLNSLSPVAKKAWYSSSKSANDVALAKGLSIQHGYLSFTEIHPKKPLVLDYFNLAWDVLLMFSLSFEFTWNEFTEPWTLWREWNCSTFPQPLGWRPSLRSLSGEQSFYPPLE